MYNLVHQFCQRLLSHIEGFGMAQMPASPDVVDHEKLRKHRVNFSRHQSLDNFRGNAQFCESINKSTTQNDDFFREFQKKNIYRTPV